MHRTKSDNAGENAQNNDCNAERNELRRKLMDEWEMVRQERDKAIKREPGNFVNLASATSSYSTQMSALQQQMDRIWDMSCQEVRRLNAQFKKTVSPGIYGFQPPDIDLSDFMEWLDQGKSLNGVIDKILPDTDLALAEFAEFLDQPPRINPDSSNISPMQAEGLLVSEESLNVQDSIVGIQDDNIVLSKFSSQGKSKECLKYAEVMAGHKTEGEDKFVVVQELISNSDGHVKANQSKLEQALKYLQSELRSGYMVVIGLHRVGDKSTPNAAFGDNATNHFVTVYRMEIHQGKPTLYYIDPGTGHKHLSLGKLSLTSDHIFSGTSQYVGKKSGKPSIFEMTRVRKNIY